MRSSQFSAAKTSFAVMPLDYLRGLTALERTQQSNLHLGISLAFIAGAANAGGFLAVGEYTSHMTGMLSGMADNLALGNFKLFLAGLGSLLCFLSGAATSAILINWGRRSGLRGVYAYPLMLEAVLLLIFGLVGAKYNESAYEDISITIALLCFVMGLQNAMITKISNSEIRTTHVTGMMTDIGIELGKILYWNRSKDAPGYTKVAANLRKLRTHLWLVGAFFLGGLLGALGYKYVGFKASIPLAIALAVLASGQFMPRHIFLLR